MAQGTRFGYAKRTLEINYIKIFGRQLTAIKRQSPIFSEGQVTGSLLSMIWLGLKIQRAFSFLFKKQRCAG